LDLIYCTKDLENACDDKVWEDLIGDFQPKINYNLQKVPFHERDDLEQEIKIKIIEKVSMLITDEQTPGFWEFLSQQGNEIVMP
jgi:hypothetical protein